ncbi:alpha-2-macroglobulin family protein [Marinoscillum sp.]|uniref:alpha-2-macroglobulin family protein n=1 Tax=Marinoscillum sp. TaxID=2024838 RepID=UPI003BA8D35A
MAHPFRSTILPVIFLVLFACGGKKSEQPDTSEIEYSEEVAQMINKITSGIISPYDPIVIQFNEDMITPELRNTKIENPFTFSPDIPGTALWTQTNRLQFTPDEPLKSRINYTGKLNLEKINPNLSVKSIDLKFYVQGQEISTFTGDLELVSPTDPNKLVYRGKISFSQPLELEKLQTAATFENAKLNWNQENDKTFSFVTDPLLRQSRTTRFLFTLDRELLNLTESLEKTIEVVPLSKLEVSALEKDETGKAPKVMIKFSDQLDPGQDINGFVSVTPDVEFNIQKLGKYVILDGDFRFGNSYKISIAKGVKSRWATTSEQAFSESVKFADIAPQVEFASSGVFMPTSNNKNLQFLTTNLKKVHVEVKKVFNSDIDQFFRSENIKSGTNRNNEFNNTYVSSVGAIIYNQTFEIGDEKNKWLLHNLSLDNVLTNYDNGLYLIRINFNPQDVLVPIEGEPLQYIQKYGQVYKPLTISDIGLLVKREGNEEYQVYTTDLKSGQPMPNVRVTIQRYDKSYSRTTNNEGRASISASSYIQLVKAEKDGQISVIKPNEMQWNNSGFDVGGLSEYELQTRAFIYTERGVYRPGDSINLSCIVRYQNKSNADNIPAYLKLYNPEGTLVMEMTQKGARDGFYNFNLGTNQNDPTGNWNVQINVGNKYFYHNLKVETVVANRLKVKVTPDLKVLKPENKQLKFSVESKYLFGAPASGLAYDTEVEIFDITTAFPKFGEYNFFNNNVEFQDIKTEIRSGVLSEDGTANITWNIPNMSQAPAPLKVKITATVQEDGGRPNESWSYLDLHPFSNYVGIQDDGYSYVQLNAEQKIPVVLVNTDGEAVTGKELVYRIYRNSKYWWYQYDSYREFKLRYKTDKHSYLVEEGTITSATPFSSIPFRPTQSGQYLIEVQDASVPMGHTSSIFMSAYPYGGIPSGDENAGTLSLRSDKETYEVGEDIIITFPSPRQGNILMTVEQGNDILRSTWIAPKDQENMRLQLKATKEMAPNVYVSITVLQDHSQTVNDRPIRMFGILPISVVDPDTKQELVIAMDEELLPEQEFEVNVSTLSGKPTQFTVAVVDEGLLDLTGFRTPDPWKEFFKKIRLDVETYDLFGHVIGANSGDVFKTFSIGGDMDYRESQLDPFEKKKRFKPVCMFEGPMLTDGSGKATVKFKMPNYVGSVRVMVVAAKGNSYGSAEKTVPVRSDLIIQPTIPRALKPGDEFTVPVNVFATKENLGTVDIAIATEGPLEVVGDASVKHTFASVDDQMFSFKVRVKDAVGQGKIMITGRGSDTRSTFEADVPVSPSASRIYQSEEKVIKPGETITFDLPKVGLDGTNNARLKLAVFPNMDFMHRLDYLIRYPYGCIEQTTSSVFPQLALKTLFKNNPSRQKEIDKNINAGIDRLRMFQLSDGGFSYWPGGNSASEWGSNYAGQFLIEARKQGYVVPDLMYDGIVRYLERQTKRGSRDSQYLMTRVNRCFVLALAGSAPMAEMNLLRQNNYEEMSNVQKWMLVTSYSLAGAQDKVRDLIGQIPMTVEEYQEFGHTYGSTNRDLGIILRCLTILERNEDAELLAKSIAKVLSSHYWYSTQTIGQMLLGIGNYFDKAGISATDDLIIEGLVELPNGKTETIKSVDTYDLYINEGYGQQVKVSLNSSVNTQQLYATMSSNGVPLKDNTPEENKNINLEVDWFNESGETIDITNVKQGSTFYGRFRVFNKSVTPTIEEVALMQILPSGWEIENTRLNGEVASSWMAGWITGKEEYLDIRDDRIMWFFDLQKSKLDFVVKVNAITAGSYIMPGARCEAMYNNDYLATKATKTVTVTK